MRAAGGAEEVGDHRGQFDPAVLRQVLQLLSEGPNRDDFYLKRRGEGGKHVQAVIARTYRRASVLWALLRDGRVSIAAPPVAQAA